MISQERMEKALTYLAETDLPYAEAKSHVKGLEYRLKVVKATQFLQAEGTVAEREAKAYASKEYKFLVEQYENAVLDMETIGTKRATENLIQKTWQSLNANERQG